MKSKQDHSKQIAWATWIIVLGINLGSPALALPPPEDTPEEILRVQADFQARSPVDNQAVSPSEYEAIQAEFDQREEPAADLDPKVKQLIQLLRLRRLVKSLLPFF